MDVLAILRPIEWAVAWVMYLFHEVLTAQWLAEDSGLSWVLSIVGLVIVMRILLIPLFFKQIKASRGMQLVAPEMKLIQKKYKGKTDPASREAMSREMMALYRKHGTNPFASCLPILLQSPIFFALFRVLNGLKPISEGTSDPIGPIDQAVASQAESSTIFGAPLSGIFLRAGDYEGLTSQIRIVTVLLIIAMCATTFLTQRQLTMKNMPPAALEGPMAQQQKILLYVLPFIFAVSGVNFPIGVLVYWTTTNLWSMGQQFYTIRRMPAPGSAAEKALQERRARRRKGQPAEEEQPTLPVRPAGQRQQPKRKDRQKARPGAVAGSPDSVTDPVLPPAESSEAAQDTPQAPSGQATAPSSTSVTPRPKKKR